MGNQQPTRTVSHLDSKMSDFTRTLNIEHSKLRSQTKQHNQAIIDTKTQTWQQYVIE